MVSSKWWIVLVCKEGWLQTTNLRALTSYKVCTVRLTVDRERWKSCVLYTHRVQSNPINEEHKALCNRLGLTSIKVIVMGNLCFLKKKETKTETYWVYSYFQTSIGVLSGLSRFLASF